MDAAWRKHLAVSGDPRAAFDAQFEAQFEAQLDAQSDAQLDAQPDATICPMARWRLRARRIALTGVGAVGLLLVGCRTDPPSADPEPAPAVAADQSVGVAAPVTTLALGSGVAAVKSPSSRDVPTVMAGGPARHTVIALAPGIRVDRSAGRVELDAVVCIEAGWLEQVACIEGTREHEALVTVVARPRDVHAALLLLGLAPGAPGSWRVEGENLVEVPPRGPPVTIRVRWRDAAAAPHEVPIATWIRDAGTGASPALDRWLFAGSIVEKGRDGVERYAADGSGSVIGLVTFGDEILALPIVRPDAEAVAAPEWEAWTERLPPIGTAAVVVIERIDDAPPPP